MNSIKELLSKYFDILNKNRKAKYMICKHTSVSFNKSYSTEKLWKVHDDTLKNQKISNFLPNISFLDLKIEIARRIFKKCCFCEKCCGIDRRKKAGNCGVKQTRISSEFLHIDEESVLIPSHTIFFNGCNFHCVFCQNWNISQVSNGRYISPLKLSEIIHKRKNHGSRNVNWVGGDPTPNLLYILETLNECNDNISMVWNSNMYCTSETMKLLSGVIDLYLTDFKYGNNNCAYRLSKVRNYLDIIKRSHKIAYSDGEMIVRHLVLPNHVECCSKPIIKWLSENTHNVLLNIMLQYRPEYKALDFDDISRYVSLDEGNEVKDYAEKFEMFQI